MSEPIVFISNNRIKEGKLEGFKQFVLQGAQLIEADKPRTVFFYAYLNEEGTEVNFVHVFPDAEAMDAHMEGVDERARDAYEFIEGAGFEIYGTPSDGVLEMMQQAAAQTGMSLTVRPEFIGGYLRLPSS